MIQDLPLQTQTAYQELMQLYGIEPSVSIDGSILQIQKAGKAYWVSRKRLGDKVVETAIGPDTPEVRERVEVAQRQKASHQNWVRSASSCVTVLRASNCLAPDRHTAKLLSSIAKTGFFRSGGVLGGTQAFRHYPAMLGVEAPKLSVSRTGDVDLLADKSVKLVGDGPGLASMIQGQGVKMDPVFGLDPDAPPKYNVGGVVELEFLSSVARGGASHHFHQGIGEKVQALKFLEFSMKDPVDAVSLYRSGIPVRVPAPERYALHKMLVAQARTGSFIEKKPKDLQQASWLVEALMERRSYELWEAWGDLTNRGKKWRTLFEKSLQELPEVAAHLEELEDTYGPPASPTMSGYGR